MSFRKCSKNVNLGEFSVNLGYVWGVWQLIKTVSKTHYVHLPGICDLNNQVESKLRLILCCLGYVWSIWQLTKTVLKTHYSKPP